MEIRATNPEYFLTQCASITNTESFDELLRQAAGTILTSAVLLEADGKYVCWDAISFAAKEGIKNNLMGALISRADKAKRGAADGIAAICSIEVPRGEWTNLVPTLVNIVNQGNYDEIATSAMTLGFICLQFSKVNKAPSSEQSEQIFTGILMALEKSNQQTNTDIQKICITSLNNSMIFFSSMLDN